MSVEIPTCWKVHPIWFHYSWLLKIVTVVPLVGPTIENTVCVSWSKAHTYNVVRFRKLFSERQSIFFIYLCLFLSSDWFQLYIGSANISCICILFTSVRCLVIGILDVKTSCCRTCEDLIGCFNIATDGIDNCADNSLRTCYDGNWNSRCCEYCRVNAKVSSSVSGSIIY